jgi:leader peptidase (prepilin peptidase)/N-methyltransferase
VPLAYYYWLFASFAFVLGAVVGSFLNVCIYRMPLNLSVNEPRRSFCPHCKKQIPWTQNLPLISWLALRGKCANCKAPIAFRYFGVELLTAALFLAVWLKYWAAGEWVLALPGWIFVGLLVVATFIDFEHFIIPDEITWGGAVAGIILSSAIPPMMQGSLPAGWPLNSLWSGLWSVLGAAVGFALLWCVVELGKKVFGKKRIAFDQAEKFTWTRDGDDADLQAGSDTMRWSDVFSRETDVLIMQCSEAQIGEKKYKNVALRFFYDRVVVESDEYPLDKLDALAGIVTEITIPREAMGFGDVKFIAAIGAFLGWQAVLFTIMSASVLGAVIGLFTILVGKREWSAKIPFGPYLALGSLIWLFAGWDIVGWYARTMFPR